jgi:4-hydroxybenzoate polyprenyltransferase
MSNPSATPPSRLLAYLQLLRLPNVFTAMADVVMGFLFTHAAVDPVPAFALLILSSSCLYLSGMVLNDLADRDVDKLERPFRPLPSGRVSPDAAQWLWMGLSIAGLGAAFAASAFANNKPVAQIPSQLAFLLVVAILIYNVFAKRTVFGPAVMGSCRMLNVFLGMSLDGRWSAEHWLIAGGLGIYVAGVTWFARSEAGTSRRVQLTAAFAVMLAGMFTISRFPAFLSENEFLLSQQPQNWTLLWIIIATIVGWRALWAIRQPTPAHVQAAVKTGILSIIALDAAVVFGVHGPLAAIAVLMLLVPTIFLGWWVYST